MLTVDDRVGSAELAEPLRQRGVPVQVRRLPAGDVSLTGEGPGGRPVPVGVERKTVMDFMNGMLSGRIADKQLPVLLDCYEVAWIVIEGRIRPKPGNGVLQVGRRMGMLNTSDEWRNYSDAAHMKREVMYRDVDHFIMTLNMKAGVRVWRTETTDETVAFLADLRSWWMKPWDKHKSHLAFYSPREEADSALLVRPSLVRRIAKELPGVGWEKSALVARAFRTVADLVVADEEEWRTIPGIGKTMARDIVRKLRGE